jgi:hypothetical protein
MGQYDVQWRWYRWLRRIALLGFLGWVPLLLLFALLLNCGVHIPALIPKLYLFLVFGAFVLLNFFPCPRCHWPFAISWWYSLSIFAWKCVHCGLKKFGDGGEE